VLRAKVGVVWRQLESGLADQLDVDSVLIEGMWGVLCCQASTALAAALGP
jgi:hypothetical protein